MTAPTSRIDRSQHAAKQIPAVHDLHRTLWRRDYSETVRNLASFRGLRLWADSYEAKEEDVFNLQARIAEVIAQQVTTTLSGAGHTALAAAHVAPPEAYDAYLRGRYFWYKFTADGWKTSATYFSEAARIDPSYALAYIGSNARF